MADLPITCRGMAYPWQCDVHGHLNVMRHAGVYMDMRARKARPLPEDVGAPPLAMLEERGKDG